MGGWIITEKQGEGTKPSLVHAEKRLLYTLTDGGWWLCEEAGLYWAKPEPNQKIPLPSEAPEFWAQQQMEAEEEGEQELEEAEMIVDSTDMS